MTRKRRRALIMWLAGIGVVAVGFAVVIVPAFNLEARVRGRLQQAGFLPPPLPIYSAPNAPADRVTARRLIVASLHEALQREDHEQAAMLNAILSQEAFQRAYRTLLAWEDVRDPDTGLLPFALGHHYQEWNGYRAGANLFSHLLIAGQYLEPYDQTWEQMLTYEREACGPMPCRIDFDSGRVEEGDLDTMLYGASEYARDGLLAITERFGPGPWFDRMIEVTDSILECAYVEVGTGRIPAQSTEVNGAQLQLLSRLYWATRDERYLQMAERIAEAYLFGVLPLNNGLPPDYWDFEAQRPLPEDARFRPAVEVAQDVYPFRLSDHGGEIISGLAEFYFLERVLDRPQADRYREPLQVFLDRVLAIECTGNGLWCQSIVVDTMEPFDDRPLDTWGYNLIAFHMFDLVEETDRYASEIGRMMRTVAGMNSVEWEGDGADGYADSIESMLYLLPWFDIPEAHYWVDDEIEVLFLKQRSDGFVEGWPLDGNFVRTALLYAQYKTQGLMAVPWSEEVRVGSSFDRDSDTLYVHVTAEEEWEGRIRFDSPRHREIWGLPLDYPRVNSAPEWYVVEPEGSYLVTNLDTGETASFSGQDLVEGLAVALSGFPEDVLRISISRQ